MPQKCGPLCWQAILIIHFKLGSEAVGGVSPNCMSPYLLCPWETPTSPLGNPQLLLYRESLLLYSWCYICQTVVFGASVNRVASITTFNMDRGWYQSATVLFSWLDNSRTYFRMFCKNNKLSAVHSHHYQWLQGSHFKEVVTMSLYFQNNFWNKPDHTVHNQRSISNTSLPLQMTWLWWSLQFVKVFFSSTNVLTDQLMNDKK